MYEKKSAPNLALNNNFHEFSVCAGRSCNNKGIHPIRIIYINKTGFFCDNCKKDIEYLGLAEDNLEQELCCDFRGVNSTNDVLQTSGGTT